MSKHSMTTRLGALVGTAVLVGGLGLLSLGAAGVGAQNPSPTPSPAAVVVVTVVATPSGPTPASNVGGPQSVPSGRFFGTVALGTGQAPSGATVTASVGGVACGFTTVAPGGSYTLDVQYISGCTVPGSTVNFSVNGMPASPTGTLPPVEGQAVPLNLTAVAATPSPAPSPVTTPPPPPPPPTHTATATPSPTPRPPTPTPAPVVTAAPSPVTQVIPKVQQSSQKAVQQKIAVTAQRPLKGAVVQQRAAPGYVVTGAAQPVPTVVVLPNTGHGGLASGSAPTEAGLLAVLLGVLTLGVSGIAASRRSR